MKIKRGGRYRLLEPHGNMPKGIFIRLVKSCLPNDKRYRIVAGWDYYKNLPVVFIRDLPPPDLE